MGPGDVPLPAQVLGQAHDQRQVAVHLGVRRDERAAGPAGHPAQHPGLCEHGERLPEGGSADGQPRRQLPLGSDPVSGPQRLVPDQVEDPAAGVFDKPSLGSGGTVGGVGQLARHPVASRSFRQLGPPGRLPGSCARGGLPGHTIASSDSGIVCPPSMISV